MLRIGDILDGKYKILTLIGKGGMSKVWLAIDTNLNKEWAIKEIDKSTTEYKRTVNEDKTLLEIEIMKKLDHPSLPRIVNVIDTSEALYVIMDYIEGETLLKVLEAYGKQDEEIVAGWMLEVCDTLEYLHNQNPPIIYRDMKPSNIMLSHEGKIKIIDFGIAREYKGKRDDTLPLGTRGYASPEHFTKKTDVRSDVYTVGVTMYQLLTGNDPADPPYEIVPLHEVDPSLSSGLEKIIAKATMPNPDDRYQTISEMADAIQSYKKLEEGYISGLKKSIFKYNAMFAVSILIITFGIILLTYGTLKDANTYKKLMNDPVSNTEMRIKNLKKAAGLKPGSEEPYIELIKTLSEDGSFTEDDHAEFTNVYNLHKDEIGSNRARSTRINYLIGENILKYYTGTTDDSARARILTAYPYFRECTDKNYPKYPLAQNYVFLANYYKEHVLVDDTYVVEEADSKTYKKLLKNSEKAADNISEYENDKNGKMRLITYEVIIELLDQERKNMADAGIDKESIIKITDKIEKYAESIDPESEIISSEKEDLLKSIELLRKNVDFTYKNKEKED